jgi:ATP-dependent Clp protease ATP-binding subunit ClpC
MMRFDRFSQQAQDVAARAYEVCQRYGHNQVDTEHILLALLEQPNGAVLRVLGKLAVDVERTKRRLDEALRSIRKASIPGEGHGQVFITPRVKQIIDLANEEATRLGSEHILSSHIFLAALAERGTAVAKIFEDAGVTKERAYDLVKQEPPEAAGSTQGVGKATALSLEALITIVELLPLEDARKLYQRLGERLNKE